MNLSKFVVSILLVGLFACQEAPRTTYAISGEAKDVYNGLRVYLNNADARGRSVAIDTAIVFNETFSFEGTIDEPKIMYLTVQSVRGRLPFMIENSDISIKVNKENILESDVTGSKENDVIKLYIDQMKPLRDELSTLNTKYVNRMPLDDKEEVAATKARIDELNEIISKLPFDFIADHKDSYAVFQVYDLEMRNRNFDIDAMDESFNSLDTAVKNSKQGVAFQATLQQLKAQLARERATDIGKKAPEFSASTPNGEKLALSDVYSKGKITIVDFWAAWCGPCRRENPNIVKIYNKYHDKGLEILGVSLDGNRNQKDPKGAWIKAIEDDQLTWNHVSNLQYFGPIASLYNVRAIPAMFILDEDGKIIAKNLRGKALENKVAELLGS